ncbi:uncharacterized protein LOC132751036 [Ruditapes philippinarum]|uniref:uncharacterized protein LOC132751036 n=1 Tax=Ruditapes philippinarum TaxID=129788 RepID=UPI00295B0B57|nr:uncharacterized protein LOC132751036 [Ruditapes philippinarum]XP_060597128.1 uncharacterized protein LOC132751036 [Ruditapes philippinarum]
MASSSPKLSDKKYNNWVKAQLAVLFTKEGLEPFVCHEVQEFQLKCLDDICYNNGLFSGTLCSNCCTENVIKCPTNRICNVGRGRCSYHRNAATRYKPDGCPDKICHNFTTEIQNAHRYYGPSYKNTDATQWCSNSWEIAKCFMPPERYKDVACAQETDFNGIISVILYYKDFQLKVHENLSHRNNIFEQARDLSRNLRHSPTLEVEDTDLHQYFTVFQQLLSDAGYLATDIHAQNAKQKLLDLQMDTLGIEYVDVKKVLNDVAREALDTIKVINGGKRRSEIMNDVLIKEDLIKKRKEDLHSLDSKTYEELKEKERKTDKIFKMIKTNKDVEGIEKARKKIFQEWHQMKWDFEEQLTMLRIREEIDRAVESIKKLDNRSRFLINIIAETLRVPLYILLSKVNKEKQHIDDKQKSWDRCIERESESDANILLEREIYPSKSELNKACHVFGRDSKIISHVCFTISQHIKKQFKNVIDVFPSYKEDYESIIFLVIVKKKTTFSDFKDYEYCIRCENDVSTEGDLVAEYETRDETMGQFDNETFEKLRNCINDNANDLLERHSNINVILPSLVKSVGYETGQHNIKQVPCIALYVTVKGCIPLNETPFQNNINGFPIDVLEGKFEPFMNGPNEYHEHLKIGLAIHANVLNTDGVLGGTLGGFIDHSTHGLCGITCAHVVYSAAELNKVKERKEKKHFSLRKTVYQPIGKSSSAFGEVVQAVYDIGGSCTSGMEVALISIQKRQPKSGSFPETFTDFEAGFDARNPLCFNSGAVCETSEIKRRTEVYKFGMISGITRGSFALQGAVVRRSQMQGDCHGFRFNLMNQLLVLQIGEKPFAEHGDSGALVLTEGGQDSIAIGIVAGGMNSRRVFVTPICDILRAFGCTESKMHRFMPKCTQLLPGDYGEKMET